MKAKVTFIEKDFSPLELHGDAWQRGRPVTVDRYWSGDLAPTGRLFKTWLLWSNAALYVRFETGRSEPLVVSETPSLRTKTHGLWERDVCEIFIAPNPAEPRRYFEFEIAPNGEWLDLAIDSTGSERKTDWEYRSGMESFARIEEDKIVTALKIPWTALGKTPGAGDAWPGNLYRCVGSGPGRGYLAWSPTLTESANFHVPERFGELIFAR